MGQLCYGELHQMVPPAMARRLGHELIPQSALEPPAEDGCTLAE